MSKILESEFRKELYKSLTEAGYEKKEAQAIVGKKYYETLKNVTREFLSNAIAKIDAETFDFSIKDMDIDANLAELTKMKEFAK
jgi:hypothetical protein